MPIDANDMDYKDLTNDPESGTSSLAPSGVEDTLDLELQAAASQIELVAVEFEMLTAEDPDQFIMLVFPKEDSKQEDKEEVENKENEEEEKAEEAPQQQTWKERLIDLLPVCPPPVCGVLKEQLITFVVMLIIGLFMFLVYWFVD